MKKPYQDISLMEFQKKFKSEKDCQKHIFKLRWPHGFKCPACQGQEYFNLPKRRLFQCKSCGHQTSLTAGTVMHRTRTPLLKWFWAIYLVSSDKRGLSALQLSRQLKVSYYVAWTMLHKIRSAMGERDGCYNLRGVIEIDESFFGGPSEGGGLSGRGSLKTPVIIEASTEGERILFAKMRVVRQADAKTIKRVVSEDVAPGQTIRTDGWAAYGTVKSLGHRHERVPVGDRNAHEVLKWVHILASNAKAFILGTFHGIGEKHLQTYLDEFCFRFNRRHWQGQLFDRLITACAVSKGITYSELTQ